MKLEAWTALYEGRGRRRGGWGGEENGKDTVTLGARRVINTMELGVPVKMGFLSLEFESLLRLPNSSSKKIKQTLHSSNFKLSVSLLLARILKMGRQGWCHKSPFWEANLSILIGSKLNRRPWVLLDNILADGTSLYCTFLVLRGAI